MATVILLCECRNEFQDKTHGRRKRVHNEMIKDRRIRGHRCTVCGKEKPV